MIYSFQYLHNLVCPGISYGLSHRNSSVRPPISVHLPMPVRALVLVHQQIFPDYICVVSLGSNWAACTVYFLSYATFLQRTAVCACAVSLCCAVFRLPLLRGGSRACAGGEDGKTSAWLSCTRQGTIFNTKIDSFSYHYEPWMPCLVHDI